MGILISDIEKKCPKFADLAKQCDEENKNITNTKGILEGEEIEHFKTALSVWLDFGSCTEKEIEEVINLDTFTLENSNNKFKDLDNDGFINEADFKDKTIIGCIGHLINRQWKIYGKAVNMLLKSINTQNKIINEDSIIKNCDLNNQSEVAVVINMIKNKSTDINDLETKLAKLFKNNNITVQMYKDGGTYHVKVGNNMKILLSNGDYRKRGHIVFAVKKGENIEKNEYMPNGEKYKYNDDTSRKYYDEYFGYGW